MRRVVRYGHMAALLLGLCSGFVTNGHAGQIMPHLFERTLYLEGLTAPLAWWANPALTAGIEQPHLLTVNVSPVGDWYTISSVRFALPVHERLALGVGVAGAGPDQTGSFQVTNSGATYESRFIFSRPSFQLAAASTLPYAGSLGILLTAGIEEVPVGAEQLESYGLFGVGLGWLSPSLYGIQGSIAALWVGHFQYVTFWDGDIKIGIRATLPEELLRMSIEYTRALPQSLRRPDPSQSWEYEALKAIVALRAGSVIDVYSGLSTDFEDYDGHNGTCVHVGAGLRKSDVNPFLGGYELGVSVDGRWHVLHRFWIGYAIPPREPSDNN